MNVASLELCKELYELSGWGEKHELCWHVDSSVYDTTMQSDYPLKEWHCPAYDLGYVLRKLPDHVQLIKNIDPSKRKTSPSDRGWYRASLPYYASATADTPEDAAVRLAIELWKQGVLTK